MHRKKIIKFAWLGCIAVFYALTVKVTLDLFSENGVISLVWPLSGFSLAVFLIWGRKLWPAIFAGALIGNFSAGSSFELSFFFALGNTAEPLIGYYLLSRIEHFSTSLTSPKDYLWLSVAGMIGAIASALIGVSALIWLGRMTNDAFIDQAVQWWQGDLLGTILFTPLILVWQQRPLQWLQINRDLWLEFLICLGLTLFACQLIFLDWFHFTEIKGYWTLLFVSWAAVRFGIHGVLVIISFIVIYALIGTSNGVGIFAHDDIQVGMHNFWFYSLALNIIGISFALSIDKEKASATSLKLAASVYEASSEAMIVTDSDNRIIAINPAFTVVTGYELAEVIGQDPSMLSSGLQGKAFYQEMWAEINATGHWQGELWDKKKNGDVYAKSLTINSIYNKDGSLNSRVGLFSDISQKKENAEMIWRQANFDTLTLLPNRRMFHDRLQQQIKQNTRSRSSFAVLFLDVDRFKEINDTLGHSQGDLLLQEVAKRISHCIRSSDTVARFGGDEFTFILSNIASPKSVDHIAQTILDTFTAPFLLSNHELYISASIGITIYPDDAFDIDTLLKNADQAMYVAKQSGRNRFHYFTPAMEAAAQNRMFLVNELRTALANEQFWVAYQPIVELGSGAIHKAEALIRWQHPQRGLISPAEFIPIAEDTGMIIDIGEWVFRQVIKQVSAWRTHHIDNFQISVNKSPVQFNDEHVKYDPWPEQLQQKGLDGDSVVVEITEGMLMDATDSINNKLLAFRDAGIQVSMDDFGTGYSSLSYLKKFDIDYLKIDQSFTRNLAPDSEDMALCEAIIVMAHKLGMKVIAEGVETKEQKQLLQAIDCDYAQGYYFSKPIPADLFEEILEGQKGR